MTSSPSSATDARHGLLYAIGAYGSWGLIPLYFKAVSQVSPLEILAQRICWACLLLCCVLWLLGRSGDLWRVFRQPHVLRPLLASTVLIALNWLTYIHTVTSDQVVEASLGYFITPLLVALLGRLVFGERLRPWQAVAMAVAVCGVLGLVLAAGVVPWMALALAATFSAYGLVRKQLAVDGLVALATETLLLVPICGAYIIYDHWLGPGAWGRFGWKVDGLLALSGPITAIPLLCFGAAARRLRMTTLGLMQFIAPSVQFLLAVLAFGEPLSARQLACFACVWLAVILYAADSLWALRAQAAPEPVAEPS